MKGVACFIGSNKDFKMYLKSVSSSINKKEDVSK